MLHVIFMIWNSKKFNLETPEDNVVQELQRIQLDENSEGSKAVIVNYLLNLIHFKKQNEFNQKIIRSNKWLVFATLVIAIATILVAFLNFCVKS